jgi:hypothetical protein
MPSLIVPARFAPAGFVRGAQVGSLFGNYLGRLRVGLERVVRDSFMSRPVANVRESEIKDRIDFCLGLAAELHVAKGWAVERIVDEMPAALRAHLDGTHWEPSKRACWSMSTKSETIQKIEEACARVLKSSDFVGGAATAITLVIQRLSGILEKLVAAGDTLDPNTSSALYEELYECGRIVGTIYDGFPMVPAEDVAALATADDMVEKAASEIPAICVELLEKAAGQKGLDVGLGIAHVRCIVDAWKASGEHDAPEAKLLVVPKAEAMLKLAKACGDKKRTARAAAAKAEQEQAEKVAAEQAVANAEASKVDETVTKLDAIAKAAEPAPAVAPPAPAPVAWPTDMNAKR